MNEEIINRLARGYGVSPQTIRGLPMNKARLLLRMEQDGTMKLIMKDHKTWLRDQEEKELSPKRRIKNHKL